MELISEGSLGMIQAVKSHPGIPCMAAGGARALLDIELYTGPYTRQYHVPVKALGGLEPGPGLKASKGCTQERAQQRRKPLLGQGSSPPWLGLVHTTYEGGKEHSGVFCISLLTLGGPQPIGNWLMLCS